jgi:hypothetical protein
VYVFIDLSFYYYDLKNVYGVYCDYDFWIW